jgi:hypothetical protein
MKQKFRGITVGVLAIVLIADMVRDFIKQGMVASKCNMDGNEAELGDKLSELILSNS